MTKQTAVFDFSSFSTDAKFRSWGSTCRTLMTAAGFVRTADTGQVDWTTVLRPTGANTKAGYEIWTFNDSFQATKPVFMKVEFGTGANASGLSPSVWITVGTGSTGAGVLTGATVGPVQLGYSATNASTGSVTLMFTHATASGYGLLNFGAAIGAALPMLAVIERTKNSSGASTSRGVGLTLQIAATVSSPRDYAIDFDTATAYSTARNPHCGFLSTAYSMTSGSDIAIFKHYIGAGVPYYSVGRVGYFNGDIADSTTFTATPVGLTSHTYFALPSYTNADSSANANARLAVLWED